MRPTTTITLLTGLAAMLVALPALAQSGLVERAARLYTEPDEYYFFEDDRKQVVDYDEERIVRICTGDSRHLVPLKITYDESTAEIERGDCMRVEAKQIYLEPAETLDPNYAIRAEVQTMN